MCTPAVLLSGTQMSARCTVLVLSWLLLLRTVPPADAWKVGELCEGVNNSLPASTLLDGKNLKMLVYELPPYAYANDSSRLGLSGQGWSGLDLEMFDELAKILGFTYEVRDIGIPADGSSWTDHIKEQVVNGDVTGGFWFPSGERLDWISFVKGHLDLSTVLVARSTNPLARDGSEGSSDTTLNEGQVLGAFLRPFKWDMWVCILSMIIISSLVDYITEVRAEPLVEDKSSGNPMKTYHCPRAGFVCGGMQYPRSITSAFYKLVLGFVVLVVFASYVAGLVNMLLKPALSATSVDDVMLHDKATCIPKSAVVNGLSTRLTRYFPLLNYEIVEDDYEAAMRLATPGGGCDAIIVTKDYYDAWRTDPSFCNLRLVQVISPFEGGWVTNPESSCVQNAFAWAFNRLEENGKSLFLHKYYFPKAGCPLDVPGDVSTRCPASRLAESNVTLADLINASTVLAEADANITLAELINATLANATVASTTATPRSAVDQSGALGAYEMSGILVIWLTVTVFVLMMTLCITPLMSDMNRCFRCCLSKGCKSCCKGRKHLVEPQKNPKESTTSTNVDDLNLDMNNEALMLREVLRQLLGLSEQIEAVDRHVENIDERVEDRLMPQVVSAAARGAELVAENLEKSIEPLKQSPEPVKQAAQPVQPPQPAKVSDELDKYKNKMSNRRRRTVQPSQNGNATNSVCGSVVDSVVSIPTSVTKLDASKEASPTLPLPPLPPPRKTLGAGGVYLSSCLDSTTDAIGGCTSAATNAAGGAASAATNAGGGCTNAATSVAGGAANAATNVAGAATNAATKVAASTSAEAVSPARSGTFVNEAKRVVDAPGNLLSAGIDMSGGLVSNLARSFGGVGSVTKSMRMPSDTAGSSVAMEEPVIGS